MITKTSDLYALMFKPGVALFGALFFLINAHYEYVFYHVNTYKICMLGLSVLLIYVYSDLINSTTPAKVRIASWQVLALIALPTLATIPGYLWHDNHNYNFRYELVSDIFLFLWAAYLFRQLINRNYQVAFFAWTIPLMIFLTGYSILEFYGVNPLSHTVIPTRPKATFGNINYFSGFLAVLIPIFLLLSLPRVATTTGSKYSLTFDRVQLYFTIGFAGLVICALLAQSRAALGAAFIASLIAVCFWAFVFLNHRHRLYILIGATIVVVMAVVLVLLALFNPELREVIIPGRFSNLFQENEWQGRTSPLIAASRAFLASPWVGWGLGSSYNLNFLFMPQDTELYLGNRSYNHVHNEFLEMSVEGGLLILLVWVLLMIFIFWKLVNLALNRNNESQNRIIAIGCMAGIMAYYGHGVFSVAQRMIVANLPFYSLLAVAMAQIYIHSPKQQLFSMNYPSKLPAYFWRFIPSTTLIVVGWILFIPILISFYYMVQLNSKLSTVEGVIAMEEHLKEWPNPYGLDDLMSKQIQFGRYSQMLESARVVAEIIPEYRSLGYKESLVYFTTGKIEKAKQRALSFQQRVGYHFETIAMLGGLAIHDKDPELFRQQLERLFQSKVISRTPHDSFNNKNTVQVRVDNSLDLAALSQPSTGSLVLSLSPDYVQQLMDASDNPRQQATLVTSLVNAISQSPVIQPPVEPDDLQQALILINNQQTFPNRLKQTIEQKRKAYLRSVQPQTKAEQVEAHRAITTLEKKVRREMQEQLKKEKEQLAQLLDTENIDDYLTLTQSLSEFIAGIKRMIAFIPKTNK